MSSNSNPALGPVPEEFFHGLASAPVRLLMLDYDGTLAPFREQRDEAIPYPGVREVLSEIISLGQTRTIVISGRAISDIIPLLGLDVLPEIWGSHGWERRRPDGELERMALAPETQRALDEAKRLAASAGFAHQCEEKPVGLALHWRGLPEKESSRLRALVKREWSTVTAPGLFDLHEFDGGLELRAPGRDKGVVVTEILRRTPTEAACAYLGDDKTDEDAFAALSGRGLAILVRSEMKQTVAEAWIRPPDDLLTFLHRWRSIDSERGPQ